jgi:hypothetical protein
LAAAAGAAAASKSPAIEIHYPKNQTIATAATFAGEKPGSAAPPPTAEAAAAPPDGLRQSSAANS